MIDSLKAFIAKVTRVPVLSRESGMTEPGKAVDVVIKFRIAPGVTYLLDESRPRGSYSPTPVSANHDDEIGEAIVEVIRQVRAEGTHQD
jgi:hypothetical protein